MRISRYLAFRYRLFGHEIRLLLQQVEQLLLAFALVLGPALLALFYGVLLIYGSLYQAQTAPQQAVLLCWSLLTGQSLLFWLFRDALLGYRYALWHQSLAPGWLLCRSADLLLLLSSHPLWWLHLLLVASSEPSLWYSVVPQLLFLGIQLCFALLALYRPKPLLMMLTLCLLWLLWQPAASLAAGLWLLTLAGGLSLLLPRPGHLPVHARNPAGFWFKFCWQHAAQLLSRLLLILLVAMLARVTVQQRPDLLTVVNFIAGCLMVLISCTLQLSIMRLRQHYALFFRQLPALFSGWQYLPALLLAALSLSMLPAGWQLQPVLLLLTVLASTLWLASYFPRALIASWLAASLVCAGLLFVLQTG